MAIHIGKEFLYASFPFSGGQMMEPAVQLHIFPHRQVLVEIHMLGHHANQTLQLHLMSGQFHVIVKDAA